MVELLNLEKVLHLEVKQLKFRCFVTKENASQFPNLVKFIKELQSKETYEVQFLK